MLKSIKLTNLLSFGPDSEPLELGPLNVLIGANGSGKSNLIEAISLLQAAPRELIKPIVEGGGLREWLWKGRAGTPVATIEVGIEYPGTGRGNGAGQLLCYKLSFTEVAQQIEIVDERLTEGIGGNGQHQTLSYFTHKGAEVKVNLSEMVTMQPSEAGGKYARESALASYNGPTFESPSLSLSLTPAINFVSQQFAAIKIYRDWSFAHNSVPRSLQSNATPSDFLAEDASNLTAVINNLLKSDELRTRLVGELRYFYPKATGLRIRQLDDFLQLQLEDGDYLTPASRLSDGTLHWLSLLAILLHPTPPPLICIEEPELGLHPDVMLRLARLLQEAATRTQLIVTTHATGLVDAFTDEPEAIVVCDNELDTTIMRRLSRDNLKEWLRDYGLGMIWASGEIGGNRR